MPAKEDIEDGTNLLDSHRYGRGDRMAENDSPDRPTGREIVPRGQSGPLAAQHPIGVVPPVVKFIGFAFLFNALLWLFGLFVQIRGWVDVTASYIVLLAMWVVGSLICLGIAVQLRLQRRWLATGLSALTWAAALVGLNSLAPKPKPYTKHEITQKLNISLQLMPPVDEEHAIKTDVTGAMVIFVNQGPDTERDVSKLVMLPQLRKWK